MLRFQGLREFGCERGAVLAALLAAIFLQGCLKSDGTLNPVDAFLGSALSDTGVIGNPAFEFDPISYDFGDVVVGSNSSKIVTVSNTSSLAATAVSISVSNAAYSITASTCVGAFAPGDTCTFTVRFAPTSGGAQADSVVLNYRTASGALLYEATMSITGMGSSPIAFAGLDSIDQVTNTSMRLVWTHVAGAQSYSVYRVDAGTPVFVANVTAPTATYTVTGLSGSTAYTYRVRMTDTNGLTESNIVDRTATTSGVSATHEGWSDVKAVGAKVPAAQASDLATEPASVTIKWNAVTPSSSSVASYNIYRSAAAGTETYSAPLATGINAATRSYTDSTVVSGTTYYYNIAPVIDGTVIIPDAATDREIKVIVPPDNMVLLHRWIANYLMCTWMGKASDRANNYRCAHNGAGGDGTHFDLGHNIFIDRFEQGCNYTYSSTLNKCGSADGCIGNLATPNAIVAANLGDIYYSRANATCYINTNGATAWTTANLSGLRSTMGSAAPGLPPFVLITQTNARQVCGGQTLAGFAGTKRLVRRTEWMLAGDWDPSWDNATIDTVKNGINLNATGHCNTNAASGITYENNALPTVANRDSLPGCLNGDCAATAATIRSVRTGSDATANCQSRFGAQDIAGNIIEWTSEQISCNVTCTGVAAAANTADPSNNDFSGITFDNVMAPAFNGTLGYSTWLRVLWPSAVPLGSHAGDGAANMALADLHGEVYAMNNAGPIVRSALNGGNWGSGITAGRFHLSFGGTAANAQPSIGFRCAFEAD